MIERHVTFEAAAGRAAEFEEFCAHDYLPALAAQSGLVAADLLRAANDPSEYQLVLRFTDADAAATWRGSSTHTMLKPRLRELSTSKELRVYEVVS